MKRSSGGRGFRIEKMGRGRSWFSWVASLASKKMVVLVHVWFLCVLFNYFIV